MLRGHKFYHGVQSKGTENTKWISEYFARTISQKLKYRENTPLKMLHVIVLTLSFGEPYHMESFEIIVKKQSYKIIRESPQHGDFQCV